MEVLREVGADMKIEKIVLAEGDGQKPESRGITGNRTIFC